MGRTVVVNLALTVVSLAAGLLLCEGISRLLLYRHTPPGMRFEREIIYSYAPGTVMHSGRLNNVGAVGDDLPQVKTPDELRVFLLGGSTSFYHGYARRLDQRLAQACPGRRITVMSWGRPRYTSGVNAANLRRHLLQLEPDIIVVYLGINDNIYNTFPWTGSIPDVGYFNYRSLRESMFLKLLWYHIVDKRIRARPDFHRGAMRSPAMLEQHLQQMIETAHRHGIAVVLATFALGWPTADPALQAQVRAQESRMEHFWGTLEATVAGVRAHNAVMRACARRYGVPLAPVANAIPATGHYFSDICHFTPSGVRVLADTIAETLLSSAAVEKPGRRR